jgi:hypothetical protein
VSHTHTMKKKRRRRKKIFLRFSRRGDDRDQSNDLGGRGGGKAAHTHRNQGPIALVDGAVALLLPAPSLLIPEPPTAGGKRVTDRSTPKQRYTQLAMDDAADPLAALAAAEGYLEAQEALGSALRDGFWALAKARLRVGQAWAGPEYCREELGAARRAVRCGCLCVSQCGA